ncbi:TetR/AcrR family transcriptional regulator [Sphingomonas xanthus]|uniref:TetR/AcrR family transcriptional regulator n=1 Tax=Sphingomonas xanthus TaxID=2594473 RepID=A0A516IQX9_9SPHN|nr:TetR/AcrR family transcriptional regulator [Sphingomonas xanthus]QDP19292.1 TetR/AcrR family transcriptional regulator [Sphingomonas xanthus]
MSRPNQRQRTRQDLLRAASNLVARGAVPTIDQVAEEAMVSRATAYRYFPGIEALLAEAELDLAAPDPAGLFAGQDEADPARRLGRVDDAFSKVISDHEPLIRLMLAQSVRRGGEPAAADVPLRQNRRTPAIEEALRPIGGELPPAALDRLVKAAAMLIGTEAHIAATDVLGLDAGEARSVRHWALAALVSAARQDPR